LLPGGYARGISPLRLSGIMSYAAKRSRLPGASIVFFCFRGRGYYFRLFVGWNDFKVAGFKGV